MVEISPEAITAISNGFAIVSCAYAVFVGAWVILTIRKPGHRRSM